MIPIIDTHQHLWDVSRLDLAWHQEEPYRQLVKNHLLEDYQKASAGIPVAQSIYAEVDAAPAQQAAEADFILDLCQRDDNRLAAAVIGGRPAEPGFADYLAPFRDSPYVKGVRQLLFDLPPEYCLAGDFVRGIQLLGDLGLRFDIETPASGLAAAVKLLDACPSTDFILDHCGNPDPHDLDQDDWRSHTASLAERDNIVVKLSGIVSSLEQDAWSADDIAPAINHLIDAFGTERVMFGSDWPVVNLKASFRQWFDALCEVVGSRSEADQHRLFHDNAVRFYGLG